MGKKKNTKKIYCFQYYVSEDTIYRYEYLADVLNCSYLIDIDDNDILIIKSDMDVVKEFKHTSDGDIVYIYTDKDDVNYALNCMIETYTDVLNQLQSGVAAAQTRLSALTATSERIKEKYPTGKKPKD